MSNLWDVLVAAGEAVITRKEFGRVMHDEDTSEEEKQSVLQSVMDAGGYDNLPEE